MDQSLRKTRRAMYYNFADYGHLLVLVYLYPGSING